MSTAYRDGYSANYFGGLSLEANPYIAGTLSYRDWRKGWLDSNDEHGAV